MYSVVYFTVLGVWIQVNYMESNIQPSLSLWKRLQSAVFMLAAIMLSIGQWSDTKDFLLSGYEAFITHFTNNVELDQLSSVKVGGNLEYIEQKFGIASLIKSSKKNPNLEYRYYPNKKYILAIATDGHKILGYQVISLDNSLFPKIPFSTQELGKFFYSDYLEFFDYTSTDVGNILYYLEGYSLGKVGLFLNLSLSYVDYGADYSEPTSSNDLISSLNTAILKNDKKAISTISNDIRASLKPNVFTVGDFTSPVAIEMLLTRYEYAAYLKD